MNFAWLPIFITVFLLGIKAQVFDTAQATAGAGSAGQMKSLARVRAQQIAAFSSACSQTATAQPGLISSSITVPQSAGTVTPPGARCMTVSAPGGARDVYAWMPATAGAAGQAYAMTKFNYAWWTVATAGIGTNMTTAQTQAFPQAITAPAIVNYTRVNP